MRTKGFFYLFLALSLISFPSMSQGLLNPGGTARGAGWLSGQLPDNARFNLELGTSFSTFAAGSGLLRNYVSPVLEYDLSPSFTIIAGGTFGVNRYNNLPQSLVVHGNVSPVHQGINDHSLFMTGKYMLSDNFFMTGTVYREQGNFPIVMQYGDTGSPNPGIRNYSSQGMSMGFGYRISDKFHFGAEIGVNRTNNPYNFYSPFSDPFSNSHHRSRHRFPPY